MFTNICNVNSCLYIFCSCFFFIIIEDHLFANYGNNVRCCSSLKYILCYLNSINMNGVLNSI